MMAEKLPLVMIDRPKMPRATWDALRNHIVSQRKRKKLELEQNAEFERQKKLEREHKKKQEAQTLEETKEQIVQLEQKLSNHKQEKHKLFQTLKKVLYEDETRRNRSEAPHPNLYLQPNVRNAPSMLRMGHTTQLLIQQAPAQQQSQHALKRPRSPSPQRSSIPPAYYRTPVHGPSVTKAAAYSTPTSAHASHYTSYPGSAVVSVGGNHLSQDQEDAARAAAATKHIYLTAAGQNRNVYAERDRAVAALHQRSLAPPPPAAHSSVSASSVAAAAAAYRPGSIISGFQRYNLPSAITTANSVTLASSITSSPRHTNGTGPPQPGSRYYPGVRD